MGSSIFHPWKCAVWTLLLTSGIFAASQGAQKPPKPTIQQIRFVRSGGLAGAATEVLGSVDLGRAEVKSQDPSYSRKLTEPEVKLLKSINVQDLLKVQSKIGRDPQADQFHYDITVRTTESKEFTFVVGEQPISDLEKLTPGLGALADFVRQESERIWHERSKVNKNPRSR
jgi:hypothetical protein